MLCRDALGSPQLELAGEERDKDTAPPGRHFPLEEVLVPVADFEAVALALGLVAVLAVGMMGGPALRVDTPYCPGLDAAGATLLSDTLTPLACNQDKRRSIFI